MSDNIYGGPFPWTSLFGVSEIGGGMSEEDIAWQAYLDYSGLPQTGATGDDYLGNFLPEIDTSVLPPEIDEIIAKHSNPEDIDNYIGTKEEVIELFGEPPLEPPFGHRVLNAYDTLSGILGIAGNPTNPDAIRDSVEIIDPNSPIIGALEGAGDASETIKDSIGYNMLSDYLSDAGDYIGETYDDVSDYIGETIGGLTEDQIAALAGEELGTGAEVEAGEVEAGEVEAGEGAEGEAGEGAEVEAGEVEAGEGAEGEGAEEGGGIKDMLSKAYDKLGIQGILGILSLLGLGKAAGASGRDDQLSGGGIGSFASSQFDPSGFGSTADYANMPGGGVGQPTWLPNTNAPIYYPFASEVTKQYNAQQEGPFSFTAGPPPDAMIQNLTSQRIPGVQYVAEGKFIRRNGLTEGPGTETSDDIPAMLSDGEFVTNAEANRGIGAMALLDQGMPQEVAMDPEQQRLAGARQMYLQQAMGQQLAKQMRNG